MTVRATGVGEAADGVAEAMTHDEAGHHHEHGEGHEHDHGEGHEHGAAEGIEWEDDMVDVNRITTPANMRWLLVDRATGAENAAIDWRFRVGDQVKIRLVNEMDSDHPMHHPIHIHGASLRDPVSKSSSATCKDTVLVRTTITWMSLDHQGVWMVHCHIAEHHERDDVQLQRRPEDRRELNGSGGGT
jgi:FtsP/CotA-like multicopper oxidase with cupredoxin domain